MSIQFKNIFSYPSDIHHIFVTVSKIWMDFFPNFILSNTLNGILWRTFALSTAMVPTSIVWMRLVLLGDRKQKLKLCSTGVVSLDPCAAQLSRKRKKFLPWVHGMCRSILSSYAKQSVCFIQAILLSRWSFFRSCLYLSMNVRSSNELPTIIERNSSSSSLPQHVKNVTRALCLLYP